jgi:hypothetical protein
MADDERPKVLGEFVEYSDFIQVIRNRVAELSIHGTRFDALAGWPEGYLSKLTSAHPVRRVGLQSMGPLLSAMGVKLVMIEDPEGTQRLKDRLEPRNNSYPRATCTLRIVTDKQWRRLQKLGGKARWNGIPKAQRREIMREVRAARGRKRRGAKE